MFWLKFSIFFQQTAFAFSGFIPLYWKQSIGLSEVTIGNITAVGTFLGLTAPLLFGSLGSHYSLERPIRWSFMLFALAAAILLAFPAIPTQGLGYTLYFIARCGFFTLVPVVFLHYQSKSFGHEYGKYRRLGSAGYLLGIIGAGLISQWHGAQWAIMLVIPCALLAAWPFCSKIHQAPNIESPEKYRNILFSKPLVQFYVALVFIGGFMPFSFIYLPLRLNELQFTNNEIAIVMAIWPISAFIGLPILGKLSDKYCLRNLFFLVPLFSALRVGLCYFPEHIFWFLLIEFLHIPSWCLNDVVIMNFLKRHCTPRQFSKAQALAIITVSLGAGLGSAFAAQLILHFGLQQSFLFGAFIPLLAIPLIFSLPLDAPPSLDSTAGNESSRPA